MVVYGGDKLRFAATAPRPVSLTARTVANTSDFAACSHRDVCQGVYADHSLITRGHGDHLISGRSGGEVDLTCNKVVQRDE